MGLGLGQSGSEAAGVFSLLSLCTGSQPLLSVSGACLEVSTPLGRTSPPRLDAWDDQIGIGLLFGAPCWSLGFCGGRVSPLGCLDLGAPSPGQHRRLSKDLVSVL